MKYDMIIIGGGAAAFAAATKATELGKRITLINGGLPLGGTCVNVGCVPTKVLLEIASEYAYPQHIRFKAAEPVKCGHPGPLNFQTAMSEKDSIVSALRESNYVRIADELGIPIIEGRARFVSSNRMEVNGQTLEGEKFIIATGSRPQIPPFKGVDRVRYITSREALRLPRLPRSMTILGAGPVALEFAQMYSRFGTRVTVLQRGRQILSRSEPELADELQRCLEEEGIKIYTGVTIDEVRPEGDLKTVEASLGGEKITVTGDELLLATGVVPNSDGLGLEVAGVGLDAGGFVTVNEELRTSEPHIWAAGDVVGKAFLETVAAKEGHAAASNALDGANRTIDYDSIPRAVFTDPQVASVGLTDAEFMRRYHTCACRTIEMEQVPRARVVKDTRGLVKMVIHPETGVIAGVHIVSPAATELIHEATLAVKFKHTVDDIIDTVHVFPTFSEAIKRVAQSFKRDLSKMSCCVE